MYLFLERKITLHQILLQIYTLFGIFILKVDFFLAFDVLTSKHVHYFSISNSLWVAIKICNSLNFFGSLIPDSHRFQHSQQILFCVNQMCISFQMKVFYFLYYPNIERQIKFYQNPFIFLQSTVKSHIF